MEVSAAGAVFVYTAIRGVPAHRSRCSVSGLPVGACLRGAGVWGYCGSFSTGHGRARHRPGWTVAPCRTDDLGGGPTSLRAFTSRRSARRGPPHAVAGRRHDLLRPRPRRGGCAVARNGGRMPAPGSSCRPMSERHGRDWPCRTATPPRSALWSHPRGPSPRSHRGGELRPTGLSHPSAPSRTDQGVHGGAAGPDTEATGRTPLSHRYPRGALRRRGTGRPPHATPCCGRRFRSSSPVTAVTRPRQSPYTCTAIRSCTESGRQRSCCPRANLFLQYGFRPFPHRP